MVQVVSGTPGRVFDMIRRRNLRTRNLKVHYTALKHYRETSRVGVHVILQPVSPPGGCFGTMNESDNKCRQNVAVFLSRTIPP